MPARLCLLFVMYLVQGLPFGIQAYSLPAYLRAAGESLTVITFSWLLALPWLLKVLWAPWVERERGHRLGRRRSWILPMQLCLAVLCAITAFVEPGHNLAGVLFLILLMNLCTATMDIAVDGLTVDILKPHQLGYGNIAQVVGYKVGMLASGGLLLWHSDKIGWSGMFIAMAGLAGLGMLMTLSFREPSRTATGERALDTARDVWSVARKVLFTPSVRPVLLLIVCYKAGETMADALFVPFLIDAGFSKGDIGLWQGTYGMIASIAGSTIGGLLAARVSFMRAVILTASLQILPVTGALLLVMGTPGEDAVITVTIAQHFIGGALTTAMFSFMMSRVDRRIGGMHYTALATVEVAGKLCVTVISGPMGDATNYVAVFSLALGFTIGFVALALSVHKKLAHSHPDEVIS